MDRIKTIERIDKLVNEYKEASLKAKYDDLSDLHNDALVKNIEVRALDIIESASDEKPVYKKQAYYEDNRNVSIPELMGILVALKDDLKDPNSLSRRKRAVINDNNSTITEEHIKRLTIPELLRTLSVGAWLLIVALVGGAFGLGYYVRGINYGIVHRDISLGQLTGEQEALVVEIWRFQRSNNLNKVIINRNGFIFDDNIAKNTELNLANKILGVRGTELRFEKLITSVPAEFLRFVPETRLDSPYVVLIPEKAQKILDTKL